MKHKNLHQIALIGIVLAVLAAGFIRLVISPIDVMEKENRTAEKVKTLSVTSYLDGSFQDSVEMALGDQLPFASRIKAGYNSIFENFIRPFVTAVSNSESEMIPYIRLNDYVYLYEDMIVYKPSSADEIELARSHMQKRNAVIARHPELDFYAYYIEHDTDIDFSSGEKPGFGEAILSMLDLPESHKAIYKIDSFEQFKKEFFVTDHHWNKDGQYRGYTELLSLVKPSEKPVDHGEGYNLGQFSGSKSLYEGFSYTEDFVIYDYDLPDNLRKIIDSTYYIPAGILDNHIAGAKPGEFNSNLSYAAIYGYDSPLIRYKNPNKEGNILLIGESFDNAITDLLACHFNNMYAVDLRHYKDFNFDQFVKENNIQTVVFDGSISYWNSADFDIE